MFCICCCNSERRGITPCCSAVELQRRCPISRRPAEWPLRRMQQPRPQICMCSSFGRACCCCSSSDLLGGRDAPTTQKSCTGCTASMADVRCENSPSDIRRVLSGTASWLRCSQLWPLRVRGSTVGVKKVPGPTPLCHCTVLTVRDIVSETFVDMIGQRTVGVKKVPGPTQLCHCTTLTVRDIVSETFVDMIGQRTVIYPR